MSRPGHQISLRSIFLGLQDQMRARLAMNRRTLNHPVAKGDASEFEWIDLLSTYLPTRYKAERAFVIDHKGKISEQIDIVIFDRHFSPFLFRQNGQTFVPAESVYAGIEVKQDLSQRNLEYAAEKIASVRRLNRTSAKIVDRGIARDPRELPRILGGIVCLSGNLSDRLKKRILSFKEAQQVDFGCSIEGRSFSVDYEHKSVEMSKASDSLVFFFLKLLARLQSIGTVPPMDIGKYAEALDR